MEPLRIANCSGFYGDRLSAAREMVEGGPIDYLTGDYLAELTMALLWRTRERHGGYARTFLGQMEEVMGACLDRGIRVVANAGGLDPSALAAAIDDLGARLGLAPRVAAVTGDDLMGRLETVEIRSLVDGSPLPDHIEPVTANAYLGCWPIVSALEAGADIVVTGRVTDAALAMGPAAYHFGWKRHDWDRLAGSLVAGHVLECGAQATGGNYAFFDEVPGLSHVGFPLVEMRGDGSFVVTKHPNTGGLVTEETVTAQLLYEIGGHRYASPDVTARFDRIRLHSAGPDRVEVSGVVGEPPPPDLKVAVNYLGGFRNQVTFVLTGLDIPEKAEAAETAFWEAVGGRKQFSEIDVRLVWTDTPDPTSNEAAMSHLRVTVKDPDPEVVGRRFSRAAVEMALASYPGFFLTEPPGDASPYAVYWPGRVAREAVPARVAFEDRSWEVSSESPATRPVGPDEPDEHVEWDSDEDTVLEPLGRVAGARSGDKGGDANVGVWVRQPEAFEWLAATLDVDTFRHLAPEAAQLEVERHVFPNLYALNFVVRGLLGEGVASSTRTDPQAKSLGEYLRAKQLPIPHSVFESRGPRTIDD